MGISRMLKMQLLGHSAVKDEVKFILREEGVVEITEVSVDREEKGLDVERSRDTEEKLELIGSAMEFLDPYAEHPSFFERISRGPLKVSAKDIEELESQMPVDEIYSRCAELHEQIRSGRESLERGLELVASLKPWSDFDVPLESLKTEGYNVQFWMMQEKEADESLSELCSRFEYCSLTEFHREKGKSFVSVIIADELVSEVIDAMKDIGAHHHSFGHLNGTPAEIIVRETEKREQYEMQVREAEEEAAGLAAEALDTLRILHDHYVEAIGLGAVEEMLYATESTFILEGWVRATDSRRLKREITGRFDEVEISMRDPEEGEEPPISLVNSAAARPYEFVTTLYGRPLYREFDPTPLLAPFFILFFAMCLTDAGYGITLAAISAFILLRFRPSGGAGLLMRLLLMGGLVTSFAGIIAGGVFGMDAESLPHVLQQFVFINPLREPMKMLNISFVMGLVHIIFGIGVRMTANIRARLFADAVFDDLAWILFIAALAPLGYAGILGGELPSSVMSAAKWTALSVAVLIFVTGGRSQKSFIRKILTGLVKFYDVVGYFGDVLSYARLLALGLATSAIAIAVNDIAAMVKGMPFYTGYVVMVLILAGGHAFNLAVNTLGAFVHSGRLQYLEFFSKFFAGGGREFRPFSSERKYSLLENPDD